MPFIGFEFILLYKTNLNVNSLSVCKLDGANSSVNNKQKNFFINLKTTLSYVLSTCIVTCFFSMAS